MLSWLHLEPSWDKTGTVAESWYAQAGKYSARVDRFSDEDGGGFAYTVEYDGNPVRNGENEPAISFEEAEQAVMALIKR